MNPNKSETNRFNKGKIYKIIDMINNFYYIGSTTSTLARRLYEHKQNITRIQSRKVYNYFNEIGFDNIKIILIKEVNVDNRNQLLKAENDIIEECLKDEKCLNSIRSWTGLNTNDMKEYRKLYNEKFKDEISSVNKKYKQKYYETYKDEILNEHKTYYQNNRDKVLENKKIYNNQNKEKILEYKAIYNVNNKTKIKEKLKQYYEENKDKLDENNLKYYYQNKEKINQFRKEKVQCICGCLIRKDGMKEHQITKKHKTFIQNQQQESEAI